MEAKTTSKTKTMFIPIKGIRNFATVVIPSEEELARIDSGSHGQGRAQIQTDKSKGKFALIQAYNFSKIGDLPKCKANAKVAANA